MRKHVLLVLCLVSAWGCHEDFLDRGPEESATLDNFYRTEAQLNATSAVLYNEPWFGFNDKASWTIGDVMSGNHWTNDGDASDFFTFEISGDNIHLGNAWGSLWGVVATANSVIANVARQPSLEVSDRVTGEAKFIRAVAYFYLVRLWGPVPIVENNDSRIANPTTPPHRVADVYRFIIHDLKEAAEVLPSSYPLNDAGRVTVWSAKALLAKVYLTRSGFGQSGSRDSEDLAAARDLAREVIDQSGLSLVNDYADLFKIAHENNEEALFAFQWVSCQEWGTQNTHQAYFAPTGAISGLKEGWGGYSGPTVDLQDTYEADDLRKDATIMTDGVHYPELMRAEGGYTYVVSPHDQDGENATFAAVKKYVVGSADDNSVPICFMSSPLNTYVQRLADAYLILAEAVLGNQPATTDPEALWAINRVRNRAGLSPLASLNWEDILRERRVEFAYEGEYWYDLVRLSYFDPNRAIALVASQERGTRSFDYEGNWTLNSRSYTPSEEDFRLPYPAGEVDRNPKLLEEPVHYYPE